MDPDKKLHYYILTNGGAGLVAKKVAAPVRDDLDHVTTGADLIGCGDLDEKVHHRRAADTRQTRSAEGQRAPPEGQAGFQITGRMKRRRHRPGMLSHRGSPG